MWALLLAWWQNSYAAVLKWVGIAFAVLLVWFNIKQSDELIAQNKNVEEANEVETDVRRLGDGAATDELRRDWERK